MEVFSRWGKRKGNERVHFWLEQWSSIVSWSSSPPAHFRREQSRHGQANLWNRAERLRKTKRRSTKCFRFDVHWFPCLVVRSVESPIFVRHSWWNIGLESWSTNQRSAKKRKIVDEVNLPKIFKELLVVALPMQTWPLCTGPHAVKLLQVEQRWTKNQRHSISFTWVAQRPGKLNDSRVDVFFAKHHLAHMQVI